MRRRLLRWLALGTLAVALLGSVASGAAQTLSPVRAFVDPLPSAPVPVPSAPLPSVLPSAPLPSTPLPSVPELSPPPSPPVSSVPVPSLPLPSAPLPSVSVGPVPSLIPTGSPGATPPTPAPELPGLTPQASITPGAPPGPDVAGASPSPTAGASDAASPSPDPDAVVGPSGTPPQAPTTRSPEADAEQLTLAEFAVPALAVGVSLLFVLGVVLAELGVGAAILPAVRRTLGGLGFGQLGATAEQTAGEEPPA